jgi:hypothetical protein
MKKSCILKATSGFEDLLGDSWNRQKAGINLQKIDQESSDLQGGEDVSLSLQAVGISLTDPDI